MTLPVSKHFDRQTHKTIHPAVAFDVDGVLADTMGLFLEIAKKDYAIDTVRMEDITCYNLDECLDIEEDTIKKIIEKLLAGSHESPLAPLPGAGESLGRIGNKVKPLLFVTARPYLGPIEQWIHDLIPLNEKEIEIIPVGSYEGKAEVLQNKGITHFVEDRLETCFTLSLAGITPILWRTGWKPALLSPLQASPPFCSNNRGTAGLTLLLRFLTGQNWSM